MTWVGDSMNKQVSDAKRRRLEADRVELVRQIEELGKKDPKTFRFDHQRRHHQEDLMRLAKEVAKIDQKLGRPVDWNSGQR